MQLFIKYAYVYCLQVYTLSAMCLFKYIHIYLCIYAIYIGLDLMAPAEFSEVTAILLSVTCSTLVFIWFS